MLFDLKKIIKLKKAAGEKKLSKFSSKVLIDQKKNKRL